MEPLRLANPKFQGQALDPCYEIESRPTPTPPTHNPQSQAASFQSSSQFLVSAGLQVVAKLRAFPRVRGVAHIPAASIHMSCPGTVVSELMFTRWIRPPRQCQAEGIGPAARRK